MDQETAIEPKRRSAKGWLILAVKIAISSAGLYLVWKQAIAKDGFDEIVGHLERLRWEWAALAVAMQVIAIGFGIARWHTMLEGQGIRAGIRFLVPSFMIGRFWGAFTPGGFGLDGWKLFDVAYRTKKYARPIAITLTEKMLGQLAFGIVVMIASVWGFAFLGEAGVIVVNACFVVIVAAGITLLVKPILFRWLARLLPPQIQPRLQTLVDAICAYDGKGALLARAVAYGVGVHAFHNLIYVCAARALGIELSTGLVFFASSMQIMATLVPITVNGVGLREAAAVALYTAVGLSESQALLIPTIGFAAEMVVSSTGVLFLLARRLRGAAGDLVVEDADREEKIYAALPEVAPERWPRRVRGLSIGAGAGLFAGMLVGVTEGAVVVADAGGRVGYGVLAYGAVAYGVLFVLIGGGLGLFSAWTGRLMKREAIPEPQAYARFTALLVAAPAFALTLFRIRRDVFHEEVRWMSKEMALVGLGCAVSVLALYLFLSFVLRRWTGNRFGRFLLRGWGSPAFVGLIVGAVAGFSILSPPAQAEIGRRRAAPEGAPNVIVIVVDTMRADHLPAYGYERGRTPSLDRFAEDAVRFEWAFSNASWTRPSFASILTGRHAASHGVMAKPDALPNAVTTLPESLSRGGYATAGYVTNFNVGPYFNFQQGFDEYTFLEPEFVLGADDAAAKLLLVQSLRQGIERWRAASGSVAPGTAYQDAETVNRHVVGWLDRAPRRPFFLFLGYMDPHDPYFPHPYDGSGYARAAHQEPDVDEAPRLRALYDGEITYWDQHFGRLMDELRRRGMYDDSLIIVTADHGEEFGEHGGFWHGTTLYDEQLHVPLFVKLPGNARGGTRVSYWVQSIDLMPSILRQIGLPVPRGVQGGSLDEGTTRVYAEESHEGNVLECVRELRDNLEEHKLITANAGNPRGLEPVELYRTADDPSEHTNVAATERARTRALLGAMSEERRSAARGAVRRHEVEMDDARMRQLCVLGYGNVAQCCARGFLQGAQCRGT